MLIFPSRMCRSQLLEACKQVDVARCGPHLNKPNLHRLRSREWKGLFALSSPLSRRYHPILSYTASICPPRRHQHHHHHRHIRQHPYPLHHIGTPASSPGKHQQTGPTEILTEISRLKLHPSFQVENTFLSFPNHLLLYPTCLWKYARHKWSPVRPSSDYCQSTSDQPIRILARRVFLLDHLFHLRPLLLLAMRSSYHYFLGPRRQEGRPNSTQSTLLSKESSFIVRLRLLRL